MCCFEVSNSNVDPTYYLVDYDLDHKASRITNFCNYMDHARDGDKGVILVEQPIEKDSTQWNEPSIDQDSIYREVLETGNLKDDELFNAKSFKIPVTYKAPLVGYETKLKAFTDRVSELWEEKVICPRGTTLTRKETLDDLRLIGIL